MFLFRHGGFSFVRRTLSSPSRCMCQKVAEKEKKQSTKICFPNVKKTDIERISSAVSLVIVGDKICWSLIKRKTGTFQVEALQQVVYPFKPRMHYVTLLQEMEKVAKEIPTSDLCITEEYPATTPTAYMFNFQLQMAQAKAMLLGMITSRPNPPMIVAIKTVAVAKLFDTFVGSERVSGQHIVEDILINRTEASVNIENHLLDQYISLDVPIRESLANAFLLNMTYWKLTKQIV